MLRTAFAAWLVATVGTGALFVLTVVAQRAVLAVRDARAARPLTAALRRLRTAWSTAEHSAARQPADVAR